jgi:hypothetical protein
MRLVAWTSSQVKSSSVASMSSAAGGRWWDSNPRPDHYKGAHPRPMSPLPMASMRSNKSQPIRPTDRNRSDQHVATSAPTGGHLRGDAGVVAIMPCPCSSRPTALQGPAAAHDTPVSVCTPVGRDMGVQVTGIVGGEDDRGWGRGGVVVDDGYALLVGRARDSSQRAAASGHTRRLPAPTLVVRHGRGSRRRCGRAGHCGPHGHTGAAGGACNASERTDTRWSARGRPRAAGVNGGDHARPLTAEADDHAGSTSGHDTDTAVVSGEPDGDGRRRRAHDAPPSELR